MTDMQHLTVVARDGMSSPNGHGPMPAFPLTDSGNAERYRYWDGEDTLYCHDWGAFLVWDGRRYARDTTGEVRRRALAVTRRVRDEEAGLVEDEDRRAALVKHSLRYENDKPLKAMVSRLADACAVTPAQLDRGDMLLNCTNGVLDMRVGSLSIRPQRREDLLTKLAPVPYEPSARAPRWESFLHEITAGNQALASFLQRLVGYGLTGSTVEQAIAFFYGLGQNGKSVFLRMVQEIAGDYARNTRPETLMAKPNQGGIPNDVAALVGARIVTTTEIDEGSRLAESLVKQITGGDLVTTRFLHGEFFDFRPTFKIIMVGNHKPVIRGTDAGIWRRILTVPFTVTIPPEQQDRGLIDKLMVELPGILAWAVAGCVAWQQVGLSPPPEVQAATATYRSEMDVLAMFFEDCCRLDSGAITPTGELYERFVDWSKTTGERQWTQQTFGRRLRERGFESDRLGGIRVWYGLRIRSGADDDTVDALDGKSNLSPNAHI